MKNTKESLFKYKGVNYIVPFILVTSLFFFWGVANNMTDTLLMAFKKIMNMSSAQTSWIQMAFYGSYFCFAFPAALFIRKYSYKAGIILGIVLYALGGFLFYPAGLSQSYLFYLISIYVLAGGCSILETTANPFILAMGSPETATRRLNMAQSFNPLGSISAILISQTFILGALATDEARAVMTTQELAANETRELFAVSAPYMILGAALLTVLIIFLFKKVPLFGDNDRGSVKEVIARLIRNKHYAFGVIAQFFYVGAQIGVWSFMIQYVEQEMQWEPSEAANLYTISIVCFIVARFIFTYLMRFIMPAKLLLYAGIAAGLSTLGVIFLSGIPALVAMVLISLFMSLMFPTIYGIALEGLASDAKIGASGLIMAILGGALLTFLQGNIATMFAKTTVLDQTQTVLIENYHASYAVPLFCFLIVIGYAVYAIRTKRKAHF